MMENVGLVRNPNGYAELECWSRERRSPILIAFIKDPAVANHWRSTASKPLAKWFYEEPESVSYLSDNILFIRDYPQ